LRVRIAGRGDERRGQRDQGSVTADASAEDELSSSINAFSPSHLLPTSHSSHLGRTRFCKFLKKTTFRESGSLCFMVGLLVVSRHQPRWQTGETCRRTRSIGP